MADADWFARSVALASFAVAAGAYWLNWRKDRRDTKANEPRHTEHLKRVAPRTWSVKMVVSNPTDAPITWVAIEGVGRGVKVAQVAAAPKDAVPTSLNTVFQTNGWADPDHRVVDIPAGGKAEWNGFIYLDDEYAAPVGYVPAVRPVIDGFFELRRRSRIARWIFNAPMKR